MRGLTWVTKSAACLCLLGACSSSSEAPSAAGTDGTIIDYGLGLDWEAHIFVQALWNQGDLEYLVFNEAAKDVDVLVKRQACAPMSCPAGEKLAGPWHVRAKSYERFPASELAALEELVQFSVAPAKDLGLLGVPPQPLPSPLSLITNEGMNGAGGDHQDAQIETDFLVAPAASFTLTVVVPTGKLSLPSHAGTDQWGVRYLDVLAVRSDIGETKPTSDGFNVEVPGPPTFDLNLDPPPPPTRARVEVDVALPADFTGSSFAVFSGWFCRQPIGNACPVGNGMTRAIPIR